MPAHEPQQSGVRRCNQHGIAGMDGHPREQYSDSQVVGHMDTETDSHAHTNVVRHHPPAHADANSITLTRVFGL